MLNDTETVETELRAAPRVVPLIRPAKLIQPSGEFLCIVRDISQSGVSVRLFHELPLQDTLTVEFQCGDRHEIQAVWQRDGAAGFRFAKPLDLAKAVAGAGQYPKRPLRLNLQLPIVVSTSVGRENAMLRNLSTQGALIEYPTRPLAISQLIHIDVPGLQPVRTKVRWRRAHTFGVVFLETFTLPDLARFAAAVQLPEQLVPVNLARA